MKYILLSGGSGKRLWPLSNESRSKQFLKVLKRDDGGMESMVQRVWRQMKDAGIAGDACVATGRQQVEMIRGQLGEVPVVLEPSRRDTFPAIALASAYLSSIAGVPLGETVAVLPVDPFVEDRFFHRMTCLDPVLEESGAQMALIGVKPTVPSEKYGYIVPHWAAGSDETARARHWALVDRFIEKPEQASAERLIRQGALWNCGVFAFRLGYMIDLLMAKDIPLHYEELVKQYDRLPKISFDYEVVEKTSQIAVIEYDGFWKDLGTWNTLTEEMEPGILGKGVLGKDAVNVHVVNELNVPIVVMGLSDIIVSASADGILVADKKASSKVKEMVGNWEERPMYEERLWGSFRVLDYNLDEAGIQSMVRKLHLAAGKHLSYHFHDFRSETLTLLSGEAELVLDGTRRKLKSGETVHVPPCAKHSIRAITDLEMVEVQCGADLSADDAQRLTFSWQDIIALCN